MSENFNSYQNYQGNLSRKKSTEKESSRRTFLKKTALIGGAGLLANSNLDNITKAGSKVIDYFSREDIANEKNESPEIDPQQKEILKEEAKSIKEIIDFNNPDKVEFNLKTAEALKNYWKERHKNDPKLRRSLEKAYLEIGEWEPFLKEEFSKSGVPEKFIYLAIPESYWKIESKSSKGAVGPYQFMPKTGKSYNLKSEENLEERCDPIKSASACARLLKDLHDTGGRDWDLALSGYNGGFYWKYIIKSKQEKEGRNYTEFLKYLEEKINKIKETKESEIKNWIKKYSNAKNWPYKVKKGDTLRKIAIKTRIDIEELCQVNNIKNRNALSINQEIRIPINEKELEIAKNSYKTQKEKEFYDEIAGFSENLNYPPKFNAVIELIQEGFVKEKKSEIEFSIITTAVQEVNKIHIIRADDKTLYNLSKRFPNLSLNDIIEANPAIINPDKIKVGDEIIIPKQQKRSTLKSLSEKHNTDLMRLIKLNPSILKPDQPLPSGFKIRI